MASILDYLDWRGDLPFSAAPFNEVDNLILSELCFLDFKDVVPAPGSDFVGLPLACVADRFFELHPKDSIRMGLLIPQQIPALLEKAASSVRFRRILLSDYVSDTDIEREVQFAALTYTLTDGTRYAAFRGTDDTIVAWKEDFNMSILESVPAQKAALAYLKQILADSAFPLRVGGHSKGGNLAVYAALNLTAAEQERILAVYNNDGPGFRVSVRNTPAYEALSAKLLNLTPHLSIVGALLEHGKDFDVVESDGKGVFQHDGFTWHVAGDRFVRMPQRSERSLEVEETLKAWLAKVDEEKKKTFINTLFDLLNASGATTLSELNEDRLRSTTKIAASLLSLDKETRDILTQTLLLFFRERSALSRARKLKVKEQKNLKKENKNL